MISVDQEIAELALDLHRRRRFLPSGLFPVPVPLSRRAWEAVRLLSAFSVSFPALSIDAAQSEQP
jgi:hypothetical protein